MTKAVNALLPDTRGQAVPTASYFSQIFRAHSQRVSQKFLHRPRAVDDFSRRFRLVDGIEVPPAALKNGLRKIDLARPAAEPSIKGVAIKSGGR